MINMNSTIIFKGNLVRDPMLIANEEGDTKCDFTVAVTTNKKNEEGKYIYNYFDCVSYGKPAVTMMNIGQKGTNVTIVGQFRAEEFKNKEGVTKTRLCVAVDKCDYNMRTKVEKTEQEKPEEND